MPHSMDKRLTYRRRHSYRTTSNTVKIVKTPGGRNVYHYRTKTATRPRCGDTGVKLNGIPCLRPVQYSRLPRRVKRVTRAYGGSLSHTAVRNRIVRAFLVEEQKIVKHVLKRQAAKPKAVKADKPKDKSKAKKTTAKKAAPTTAK